MTTSTQPIGVAVLGYGLAGQAFHAPLIAATAGLELRAIVSSRPIAVRADWPEVEVLARLDAALERDDIALIVVATPDALHADQAIAALEAGRHVVVDKPFAQTLGEAERIAAAATRTTRVLSVFQNRRWDSDFLTLRRLIADGELGEVVQFESHFDRFRPMVVDRWKERPGAGVWQDLGPHLVDQALQLFGAPLAVYADLAGQKPGAPVADYAHILLRYERLRVILHAGQIVHDASLRYAVHGTSGSFIKHGLDPQESQSKAGLRPGDPAWGIDPSPGVLVRQGAGGPVRSPVEPARGDYPSFYSGVRDAIATGAPPPVTAEEALMVMRVIDAGHRSHSERREIPFPTC
jgi:predicted dehydrogenase